PYYLHSFPTRRSSDLTALHDVSDKIKGLDNGADDYMTKPFSPQELISRIMAIFRRIDSLPGAIKEEQYQIGKLLILADQRQVYLDRKSTRLNSSHVKY